VALWTPQIEAWLSAEPDIPGAFILRRLRYQGYRGSSSAAYELVRRLRVTDAQRRLATGSADLPPSGALKDTIVFIPAWDADENV
jgi:hypothetical protein